MPEDVLRLLHEVAQRSIYARMLQRAIAIMSVTCFAQLTTEEIFGVLANQDCYPSFSHPSFEWLKEQINRMEKTMSTVSKGVADLQAGESALAQGVSDLKTMYGTFAQAMLDAEARLQASIDQLESVGGSGDVDAITAVTTDLKAQLDNLSTLRSSLQDAATSQATIDPPVTPPPPPPAALAISPKSVSVLRSATVQFSTNLSGATFSALSGSIDATGLYTPPTDTSLLTDSVTATSADGTQTDAASISIS